jgi:hypothetical protein
VIYRHEKSTVHIVHVVRGERLLDKTLIGRRAKGPKPPGS